MNHMFTALAVMLLVPLQVTPTFAERPSAARLMSDQTLAYVRIADSREYGEKFSQTSLGKALQDPQMRPFMNGIWQTLKDTFSEAETKAGVSLEALLEIPQGELAASVVAMQEGSPAILLLCSLGEDLRTAEKLLQVLETAAEGDGATIERSTYKETKITLIRGQNGPLAYALHDHTLLASSRMEAVEDLIEHWDGDREDSLASDNRFNTIIASSRGTNDEPAQLTWFVNPIELLRAATRQNSGGGYIMAFMPVLGLDGVKSIGGSQILATEDFDSISHFHVMLERPRTGVLEVIQLENASTEPESWVPEDITSYMTVNWDVEKSYDAVEKLYDSIIGEGKLAEDIDRRINQPAGIDFKSEIVENLVGRFTLIQWYEPPARINSQATLIAARVTDPASMQRTLEQIVQSLPRLKESIEQRRFGEATFYQLATRETPIPEDADDERRRRLETRRSLRPQPCFGILGDFVFFADRPGIVERITMTYGGDVPRLADDLSFRLIVNKLQNQAHERKIGLISFSRPEEVLRGYFELAKADSTHDFIGRRAEDNSFFRNLQKNVGPNTLPDFHVISKYLAPSGSLMIDDETGLHMIGFQLKRETP